MTAFIEILTVSSILLLILSRPVSIKFALKTPKKYRIDFFLFAIEGKFGAKKRKRGFKISRFINLFSRIRPRAAALRYIIRHSRVKALSGEEYDLSADLYFFRLCLAALIALKYALSRAIKRRIPYVGK